MEETLTQAIANYIEERKHTKLEPLQKGLHKVVANSTDEVVIAKAKIDYELAAAPIEEKFKPEVWLTDAAAKAKRVNFATHVPKFTHSSIKGASSFFVKNDSDEKKSYLITANIFDKDVDTDVDAAAMFVVTLLRIEVSKESLYSQIKKGNINSIAAFTDDMSLRQQWLNDFKLVLDSGEKSSHTLSKQLYFPTNNINKYHLICPIFSSTLSQKLYLKVIDDRFGDAVKEVREHRKKGHYHERPLCVFTKLAVQKIGGANTQNVSQLNVARRGQSFLLNSAPPTWRTQTKPPIKEKTIFDQKFSYRTGSLIKAFKAFLVSLQPNERDFETRYKRDYLFILPIIHELLDLAATIQAMPAGWATALECKLKIHQRLWLDSNNTNKPFQFEREKNDWLPTVAEDFSTWLSQQLKNDQYYKLGDAEHIWFKKLCLRELKRFERATPKLGELR